MSSRTHRHRRHVVLATGLAGALLIGPAATAASGPTHQENAGAASATGYVLPDAPSGLADLTPADRADLARYLADTWTSLDAMTDPTTGLPADNITGDLSTPSSYTSPTNIGGYLWSTVVAREAGLIDAPEARARMATTLDTLDGMQRHEPSGMYYNWYDPATGDRLDTWPDSGDPINQFLSSVDNGWLAAALRIVSSAEPSLATEAGALYDSMDFGVYYNAEALPDRGLGLIRGGFWDTEPVNQGGWVLGDYLGTGTPVYYTGHHYDTTVSETRIATYIGIANGQIPANTYYATWRTFPSTCDWSWQEQRPSGVTRSYDGVEVYEGVYPYRGMSIVPGWGGSMFEALMPDMLVPESEWGQDSWAVNHPLVVRAQKEHGLDEAGYGMWGFSPASNPHGGYLEYGVDQLGLSSSGYLSDGTTDVDAGYFGCREATNPDPTFGDGVVTPHASFLGLAYDPVAVLENAAAMEAAGIYGPGGFYDAYAVRSETVAERYLSLDQSMIVAALGNFLHDGLLREHFVAEDLESTLRPVMAAEVFSSSAADVVPTVTTPAEGASVAPGSVVFTGRGEPGAEVSIAPEATRARAAATCVATIDAAGDWSCASDLTEGAHAFAISTTNTAGITTPAASSLSITVTAGAGPDGPDPASPNQGGAGTDPADASSPGATTAGGTADRGDALATTGAWVGPVVVGALALLAAGAGVLVLRRRARA